jgi:glycosyltransferase involved in cell wall biosynthesis
VNEISITKDTLVSIVLPVYNQAEHIAGIMREYEAALTRLHNPHEFILVVNGCRDNSLEVCRALAGEIKSVRVVDSERGGWGLAVKMGLQAARGDLLCYANSARTNASDLLLMILYAVANPDSVVKAHRRSREDLIRRLGSFLYNLQCRVMFDLPTWDVNGTPKVFSRGIFNTIPLTFDGDLVDLEFFVRCKERGWLVLEVDTYRWQRHSGESTTKYRSALRLYYGAYRWWRDIRSLSKEG